MGKVKEAASRPAQVPVQVQVWFDGSYIHRDLTPPSTARDATQADLRHAVAGKQLVGVVLIGIAIVLALAMYFDVTARLGNCLDRAGSSSRALPAPDRAGRDRRRPHPQGTLVEPTPTSARLGARAGAALGLLHVVRDPESFTDVNGLGEAGGWLGAVLVELIATLIAVPGAVVVMLAMAIGGALLITQTSLRTMAIRAGHGVGAVAKPLGRPPSGRCPTSPR